MMKKYQALIVTALVIALLVIILYFIIIFCKLNVVLADLPIFTNIVSILSSILLLAIAFVLFNKYGGDQKVLDKQMVMVMGLIEYLSKLQFSMNVVNKGKSRGHIINLSLFVFETNLEFIKETPILSGIKYDMTEQFLSPDFENIFSKITSFTEVQFMPKKIVSKIELVEKHMSKIGLTMDESDMPSDYIFVNADHEFERNSIQDFDKILPFYGIGVMDKVRFESVINDLRDIYSTADKWLKENNGSVYSSLNILSLPIKKSRKS